MINNKFVVLLGDGELNEGSVWESLQIACAKNLDNLYIVIDRNWIQANVFTEDLIPLESLEEKFSSFGAKTFRFDGNSFQEIHNNFTLAAKTLGHPSVLIANTIRGKGLSSIENDPNRWFVQFSKEDVKKLITELHGGSHDQQFDADITMVR